MFLVSFWQRFVHKSSSRESLIQSNVPLPFSVRLFVLCCLFCHSKGWNRNHSHLSVGRSWGETQILGAAYLHVHRTKIGTFIRHKRGHAAPIHWLLVEDEGLGPGPSHSEIRVDVPPLAYLNSEIVSWYKINIYHLHVLAVDTITFSAKFNM